MIHSLDIEHRPLRILSEYFERALADIGLSVWLGILRPGNEENFRRKISSRVYSVLSFKPWEQRMAVALVQPEAHLRWEPWEDPEEEIWAHYRWQSAVVATLIGDQARIIGGKVALGSLAAQLITEPMNRKLAISHFLGNLTEGRIGLLQKELPTKSQILQWVRESRYIESTDKLDAIARLRYE